MKKNIKSRKIVNGKLFGLTALLLLFLVLPFFIIHTRTKHQENTYAAQSSPFVTRIGSTLYLNGQRFRFAGTNLHWLGLIDNGQYPTTAQIDAGFAVASQMHATVIRSHSMGISIGCLKCIEPALNQFNDTAFQTIDYAIKRAADYHMHLIIPLSDNWHYYTGGKHTFTDWRGLANEDLFFTDPNVISDFKTFVAHVLNHVNQYTGLALKDDPTILFWEEGNELHTEPYPWGEMMAQYIKSIDHNHLVTDGRTFNRQSTTAQLQSPDIDAFTNHQYPLNLTNMQYYAPLMKQYQKVFYIGEYDVRQTIGSPLPQFLAEIENDCAFSGDTFWQLYPQGMSGDQYTTHYPGDNPTMQSSVQLLTNHAIKMTTGGGCGTPGSLPTTAINATPAHSPYVPKFCPK